MNRAEAKIGHGISTGLAKLARVEQEVRKDQPQNGTVVFEAGKPIRTWSRSQRDSSVPFHLQPKGYLAKAR